MASILSYPNYSSLSQNGAPNGIPQINPSQNFMSDVNSIVQQIVNSQDPQQTFQQIFGSNPLAQNSLKLIQQYGNGDVKTAFENYAASQGKQALAQQILQKMGLI